MGINDRDYSRPGTRGGFGGGPGFGGGGIPSGEQNGQRRGFLLGVELLDRRLQTEHCGQGHNRVGDQGQQKRDEDRPPVTDKLQQIAAGDGRRGRDRG